MMVLSLEGTGYSKPQEGDPMGCSAKNVKVAASQPKEVVDSRRVG